MAEVVYSVHQAVDELLTLYEFSIDTNLPVIIKPNICCTKGSETGATTDPIVVEALISCLKHRFKSKNFFIVESNATALNADLAFKLLGYEELARRTGARTVNLSSLPFRLGNFPQNYYLHKLKIPDLFWGPHFLVSVAKLKTNSMCHFTGTLKNIYGCNPEPFKAKYHPRLHEAIADIASVFRPDFTLVDAIIAMEGSGPVSGTPVRLNRIIAGKDPVAVDACIAKLIGMDSHKIGYIKYSEKAGLGSATYQLDCSRARSLSLSLRSSITDKVVLHAANLVQSLRRNKASRF